MKAAFIKGLTVSVSVLSILSCSGGGAGGGSAGLPSNSLPGGSDNFIGCTDASATNYNPIAIVDDGSCLYNGSSPRQYKAYFFPPSNSVPMACDGTVTAPYSMTYCMDETDISSAYPVDAVYCQGQLYPNPITFKSPAGNKVVSISNGTKRYACAEGTTISEASSVIYNCNPGYYQSGSACIATPPAADTTAPTIYMTSSSPSTTSVSSSVKFSFYTDEESSFFCQIDGAAPILCGTGTTGSKTVDQLGSINVAKSFKVWAVDNAGNSGENVNGKYYSASWQAWSYKTLGLYDFEGGNGNDSTGLSNHILGTFFSTLPAGYNGGYSLPFHTSNTGYNAYIPKSLQLGYGSIDTAKGITVEAFVKESDQTVGIDMPIFSKQSSVIGSASLEVGIKYTSASAFKIYYMISCSGSSAPQRIESPEFIANISSNFGHVAVSQVNSNVYFYFDAAKKGAGTITAGGCTSNNKFTPNFTEDTPIYVGINSAQVGSGFRGVDFIDRLRISRTDRSLATDTAANLCRGSSICAVD